MLGLAALVGAGALGLSPAAEARAPASRPSRSATLPDWNGAWDQDWQGGAFAMFDPLHVYKEPDSSTVAPVGVTPGDYLTDIPLRPEYKKQYMDVVAKQKQGESPDTVGVGCRSYGMPRAMFGTPGGPQIFMTPEVVAMIGDVDVRMIYTDGRPHPTGDDAIDTWDGHSIGHWEGDTLVVDTVNVFPGNYDQTGAAHSGQIHIVERLRLLDHDTLQDQMTIEDPVTLERPWTVVRRFKRHKSKWPNKVYTNCGRENDIDFSNGYQSIILPSERPPRTPIGGGK